jgi:membrane associated rhomboid family serine protease
MIENFIAGLIHIFNLMKHKAFAALIALGLLWGIQIVNALLRYRLNILGLTPRRIRGIPGIIFSPFLHGSFTHIFFNSIPFFVLLDFMLINGTRMAVSATIFITLAGGCAVWLLGRKGNHVGASGLIMGYLAYLLVDAYAHPSIKSIMTGIICVYYFGSLLFSVFPKEDRTSWEGHLFGFMAGLGAVFWGGWSIT